MKATSHLGWQVDRDAEGAKVAFMGELDESADFRPLLQALPPKVTFDVAGIQKINSCGVREWVRFVDALTAAGTEMIFERCSVAFVAQLNMIANFKGNGQVRSIFAPFVCTGCNHRHDELLDMGPDTPERLQGTLACPQCGAAMELDDLPDSYLGFV